ncbi:MAG: Ig domain-containing protein, partial [Thermoanaerobaculia bacterium]
MTFRTALRLVLAAALGTSTLLAAETTYLPGAAELAGLQGARFSSTLELTNPGDAVATATIGLVPMAGKTAPAPVVRTLAAGESVRIEAALKTLFGLAEDGAGTITVLSDAALLASLTTRNVAAAEGPYGLGLFAVPEAELLGAGETGHSIWVSHSADPTTGYRTNLSVTLVDPGTIVVVRVFDADGSPAGETTLSAETPQVWQKPVTAIAGEAALPVGRAEFEVKAGRATAYAVVNDNVTSDAIALQSERVPAGATERLVSGAALSPGHLGAFWVTDLRIFNPGAEPAVATIRSLGAPTPASAVVPVPAHGVVEVPRVLAFLGFPERTASALRVSADTPLLVAARTNNVDPAGLRAGTFSAQQFVSVWPTGLLGAGATGYFTGIDQTLNVPGTRTNLALVGGPEGAAGALVLRDEQGAEQGRAPFRRAPGEWGQLGVADWFASAFAGATSRDGLSLATVPPNSRIDVTVEQGALDAYVSQIDNGSGDAVTRPFGLPGGGDCSKVAIDGFEARPFPVKPGVETTISWTIALDPPTAELTSQSIRFDGGAEVELDKSARSYTTSFPEAGSRTATLTVRKGSCVKARTLQIAVCGELVLEPATLVEATVGEPYAGVSFTAPAGRPPLAFRVSEGAPPAGLVLTPAGRLEGTPAEAGTATFTVAVTDANGCTGERAYTIEVGCPQMSIAPADLPGGTVGTPYATVVLSVTGGSGSGTFEARRLPPGLSVSSNGRIEGTPTEAGRFDAEIVYRDANGCDVTVPRTIVVCNPISVEATLPAATAGVAIAPTPFTVSGAVGATTFAVTAGALPAGTSFDGATGVLSGTPTVVGTFPFTVTATDTLGCTGSLATSLTVSCPTITVSPASFGNGTAGVAYGPVTLTQTGGVGTVTYGVTTGALPAGVTLSSAGVLSGTPTVTGTFTFTVTATDANACTGTQSYTLVVDCPVIAVSPATLGNGTAGVAYGPVTLTQAGGVGTVTYAVTAGALPAGVTLSTAGVLTGTPTVTGSFSFTVTATDANG